uniref:Nucleolin n=1 Tax=Mastacembelus armatus TaxID=205130 RepID=A0A3Q3L0N4_9TELE
MTYLNRKFGYVDFASVEDMQKALELNGKKVMGQEVKLDKARSKDSSQEGKKERDARTLFVKNLPFSATVDDLKEVFEDAVEVRLPPGQNGSDRGIAYIEFKTEAEAEKMLEEAQGADVQGRSIIVDYVGEKSQKRAKVAEVLVQVFGHDEEGTKIEPEIEEDVSEVEDNTDFDPDFEETDQSTDGEGEGEAPEEQEPFQSKSGHLLWSSSPQDRRSRARVKNIKITPGPTRYATSRVDDIKSSFQLFLPESIEGIIVEMTNLEGKRVFGDTWRKIDLVDLQAYIGLLILAGVYRSNNEATKSLWDAESGRPIFRATMSLQQFHVLSRIIRFDNRDTRRIRWRNDKLALIRNIWDRWVERLPLMYNPGPEVTVDERLVPFRGRCSFKVYIPSKPGKYGIKIWAACDARSSYAWNMQVYVGKPSTGGAEKKQGMRVVLDMTTGLQGHNITCDNFFTSYALGQELLKRKLTMVGTVRKNKPELPPALVSIGGREALSSKFAFTDTHTLVSYVPKKNKNVILMSTLHKDAAVSSTEDKKPLIIQHYNKNKGGVDCLDKVM